MINRLSITSFLILLLLSINGKAQEKEEYYVKHLEFPFQATLEEKVKMAAKLVPTPQQYAWQQMELTAFLHFGINTFTNREWGDGNEDPSLFYPSELDAEQWIRNLKEVGFKMVILTAKHHDGFCLWPTATTKHSVASSPWKNGKGDVVKELREACRKYDMKFGVYLSPWDRNADCYGDSPRYNQFFINQLTELLTNYGEIHEVWFDGANGEGPNGKKQVYDWNAFYKTIQRLQPKAVMAIMGDDVRWVGNEKGLGRETEWSTTVLTPGIYERSTQNNSRLNISNLSEDLGSRAMLEQATEAFWYPSEVDVSIRPGWFYHKNEDSKVKSLKQLVNIYFQSVGYNSVLLLNIPPDTRGLIHETDIQRLKEFAEYRKQTFADNKIRKGNRYWNVSPGDELTYRLKKNAEFNVVMLQEDITKGQRVEKFTLEALTDKGWTEIAQGTTVGYKRLLRFPTVKATRLRVRIDECRLSAHIKQVAAYYAPPLQEEGTLESWNTLPRSGWKVLSDTPLVIDLGKNVTISSFTYAPYKAEPKPSIAYRYTLYTSTDGKTWKKIVEDGEFSNIMNNPIPQTVTFEEKVRMRFIKMEATTMEGDNAKIDMKEIGVTVITD